jgi:hypothetical protein
VEEAYQKMEQWQKELEEREQRAQENLRKQQQMLHDQLAYKSELKNLRKESALLNQKRKENRLKLAKDEQMQKIETEFQSFEQFKKMKLMERHEKQ